MSIRYCIWCNRRDPLYSGSFCSTGCQNAYWKDAKKESGEMNEKQVKDAARAKGVANLLKNYTDDELRDEVERRESERLLTWWNVLKPIPDFTLEQARDTASRCGYRFFIYGDRVYRLWIQNGLLMGHKETPFTSIDVRACT